MYKKSIIVTGGTDGIGLALVKKLIEKDQYVFIIGRNPEKGNAILNDIKSKNLEMKLTLQIQKKKQARNHLEQVEDYIQMKIQEIQLK